MKLLIATHNRGKLREYAEMFDGMPLQLLGPDDLGLDLDVKESGETYADNARLKAEAYAQASGLLTLADDSGLEVDALDGAPGVRSARYAPGDDADRVTALLHALEQADAARKNHAGHENDAGGENRAARFRCVIVLVSSDGHSWTTEGECPGRIIDTPRGSGGFGYDPVFYLPTHDCTMAELAPEEKNRISHRARAAQALRPILAQLAAPEN